MKIVIGSLVMATVLLSGFATVNINHHLIVPAEVKAFEVVEVRNNGLDFHTPTALISSIVHPRHTIIIRLNTEIRGLFLSKPIIVALQNATEYDTVIFRLAGMGGLDESALDIINNIHSTKAHTIAIVDAPVYSAHAYIASSTQEMHMAKYSYLMFHSNSALGTDCSKDGDKLDRGVPEKEHCEAFIAMSLSLNFAFLQSIPFLTLEELKSLETGHDVYITPTIYHERTGQ